MDEAATLPSPMAEMTVAPPETMSPPAHTRALEVFPFSSVTTVPDLVVSRSGVVEIGRAHV